MTEELDTTQRQKPIKSSGEISMVPQVTPTSYYGNPILKAPVWKAYIPAYFVIGGLSGASATLALGAQISGNLSLAHRSRLTALVGIGISAGLLVEDLGRRDRFYNMLRVVKVTSPMSIGTWVLAVFSPAIGMGVVSDIFPTWPIIASVANVVSGILGPVVSTYTAVLISNTAVPVWHEARKELPFVFAASSASAAGGLATFIGKKQSITQASMLGVLGAVVELAMTASMEAKLGFLAGPYKKNGKASLLSKLAKTSALVGVASTTRGKKPWVKRLGGLCFVASSVFLRFSIFEAGIESTKDPSYVVEYQKLNKG